MTIDQRILQLVEQQNTTEGLTSSQTNLLDKLLRIKSPKFEQQQVIQGGDGSKLPINESLIKELYGKAKNGDRKAESELNAEIARITKDYGKNTVDNLLDSLD